MSKNFAVIGHPIAHTMSPFIHKRLFFLSGKEAEYGVLDIAPDNLAEKLGELKSLDGFNITIPHKQAIMHYLDEVDEKAKFFHSVNTVKNENGRLTGYTTDGIGFCKALKFAGVDSGGRTVILGAGGAARVLAFEAVLSGGRVTVAARNLPAAQKLRDDLNQATDSARADCCLLDEISGSIDLLANATPVGMYPNIDACPVSEQVIRKSACVFDAVYNPKETVLLRLARKNGIKTVGGMEMLVWQAAAAHEIWYGAEFRAQDIEAICADAAKEMKKKFGNIILCGFMGCGKTSVGNKLAKMMNRTFVDMDQYIEQQEGATVSQIFAERGEAEFRRLECEAAKALSRKSGLILAAGGGTLLNPDNAAVLKETGIIIFLDAELKAIKRRLAGSQTRPLLAGPNRNEIIEKLYHQRINTYRATADFIVPANDNISTVAKRIQNLLD